MSRNGITFEDVANAAISLENEGINPTIERIRTHLGGTGSNSTISKYLNRWREQVAQPPTATITSSPPDPVKLAVDRVWQQITEQANTEIGTVRKEAEEKITAAEEQARMAAAEVERVLNNYRDLEQVALRHSAEKEVLHLDFKQLQQDYNRLEERYASVEKRLAETQAMMTHHIKDLATAHNNEILRLEEKYRSQEQAYIKLIDEIKDNSERERHRYMADSEMMAVENKKLQKKIQDLQQKNTENVERMHGFRSEVASVIAERDCIKNQLSQHESAREQVEDVYARQREMFTALYQEIAKLQRFEAGYVKVKQPKLHSFVSELTHKDVDHDEKIKRAG